MQIIPIETIGIGPLFEFLKEQYLIDNSPAIKNMWDDDWSSNPHTLPYILENTDRFKNTNGKFFVLMHQDKVVGCSGIYKSEFDDKTAIAGCRTLISKNFRNQTLLKKYFFPEQKVWAIKNSCRQIALTFNEYNKNLIEVFKRTRLSEDSSRVKNRQSHELFYKGLKEIEYPVIIQKTKQWVIYEDLDNYNFDWSSLKCLRF